MEMVWLTAIGVVLSNIAGLVTTFKYFNSRLARIYERLDEVKAENDGAYVRKDMCKVMHEQTSINLSGLEARIEKRFDKLEALILKDNK